MILPYPIMNFFFWTFFWSRKKRGNVSEPPPPPPPHAERPFSVLAQNFETFCPPLSKHPGATPGHKSPQSLNYISIVFACWICICMDTYSFPAETSWVFTFCKPGIENAWQIANLHKTKTKTCTSEFEARCPTLQMMTNISVQLCMVINTKTDFKGTGYLKSVGLCKRINCTSVYLFLYRESSVKISTQTDSY